MKKEGYYSSGDFAKMAHITKKTVRYYDEHNILKPSYVTPYGARFYTDEDFARLQQILLLKYLGFSLEDIREMTVNDSGYHFLADSLKLQLKLVQDKIEQLQTVERAIKDTSEAIQREHSVDWTQMLHLIHLTGMEKSLRNQYQNASNISARIKLHNEYANNTQGWFPWIYERCSIKNNMKILEIGCGDGSLWLNNFEKIPKSVHIILSDISEGMLRDTRRAIGAEDFRFEFNVFDCHHIPYEAEAFDLVIANHVLFYCDGIEQVCKEIWRVLKVDGTFLCSTYGENHMKEISQLVSDFDDRIVLSADKLYERFGKSNGAAALAPYFRQVTWLQYEDFLHVTEPEPLISYILSCHGNQNQYIIERYKEFRSYVKKKTTNGFHITKDAGLFLLKK